MIRLNIPYRSQWDKKDAGHYSSDCGPTCAAMVLNYHNISITPNQIYAENFPEKGVKDFTTLPEMGRIFKKYNVPATYKKYSDQQDAVAHLRTNIDAGKPLIALVRYQPWQKLIKNYFKGGHFVVVTGYDDAHIYMHDPLFGLWITPGSKGAHFAMPIDLFCEGWGGLISPNPDWACFVLAENAAAGNAAAGQPTPQPAPAAPPKAEPAPAPPAQESAGESGPIMQDVNRRIRALAAYRWAEEPNFDDETAVKLWRDHLGDFGLHYDEYIVQGGDYYSSLAERFYGASNRWPAIRAYNPTGHEGLWAGEHILIPKLGQSNAHLNPALPMDTIDFAKALNLDDLVDPEEAALDYDSFWDDSINLGFDEMDG